MTPLLQVDGLAVTFRIRGGRVDALTDVDLSIDPGEIVGLVGASGAGKSTVARAAAGLVRPKKGRILLDGQDIATMSRAAVHRRRRECHLIFQDPYASLPPTLRVAQIVAEPLVIHRLGDREYRRTMVHEALSAVHLTPVERYLPRYAHQLSGGERQRVAFARALVTKSRLILADEPTQMLDASLRAEVVDLIGELRAVHGVSILYVTHDLALAQRCCDRLVILNEGRVVEHGATETVLAEPRHPYTVALIAAARRLYATPDYRAEEE